MLSISDVESCVRCASVRTSSATTAKPRPDSPARAASIAAFKARRLVCSAIFLMTSNTLPIERLASLSSLDLAAFLSSSDTKSRTKRKFSSTSCLRSLATRSDSWQSLAVISVLSTIPVIAVCSSCTWARALSVMCFWFCVVLLALWLISSNLFNQWLTW